MKWWDQSWNANVGCTKCSPGCTNCYAESLHTQRYTAKQEGKKVSGKCYEKPFSQIQLLEERLEIPLRRKKPTVYFVNSMSDLFHRDVPFVFIEKVMAIIESCPQHTFLVLTKRPHIMTEYFNGLGKRFELSNCPNLWLGVTVCNQEEADKNIPLLLQTPAAHRFLSIDPMLEEIDFTEFGEENWKCDGCGLFYHHFQDATCNHCGYAERTKAYQLPIDQVILGGETGKNARPMHPDWAKSIRDQCKEAGVSFMFKQWGEWINSDCTEIKGSQKNAKIIFPSGETYLWQDKPWNRHSMYERNGIEVVRVGKKKAGRLLDGVEHNDLIWRR